MAHNVWHNGEFQNKLINFRCYNPPPRLEMKVKKRDAIAEYSIIGLNYNGELIELF